MKEELVEFKDVHSELIANALPKELIVNTLEDILIKLESNDLSGEKSIYIENFFEAISNWQIVVTTPKDITIWLQMPLKYFELKREFNFKDRLKIFKDEKVWVPPVIIERFADMISNVKVPVEIELSPLHSLLASVTDDNEVYYPIAYLLKNILQMIESENSETVAIYEKPYGVIAMNTMTHWLNKIEQETMIKTEAVKSSLRTIDFSELITTATLTSSVPDEKIKEFQEKLRTIPDMEVVQ